MANNNNCNCACHSLNHEYRLMRGTSYEGISIREVLTDDEGIIVGWNEEPIIVLAPSKEEALADLELAFEDMGTMFAAFDKPVLDEGELEGALGLYDPQN